MTNSSNWRFPVPFIPLYGEQYYDAFRKSAGSALPAASCTR